MLPLELIHNVIQYQDVMNGIKLTILNKETKSYFNDNNFKIFTYWNIDTNLLKFNNIYIPNIFKIYEVNITGRRKLPKLIISKYLINVKQLTIINHQFITNRNLKLMQNLKIIKMCHCNYNRPLGTKFNRINISDNFECCIDAKYLSQQYSYQKNHFNSVLSNLISCGAIDSFLTKYS